MTNNTEFLFKLHLRFLKDNDILTKYKNEYHNGNKTPHNTKNIIDDLKRAVIYAYTEFDSSAFHLTTKGFTKFHSIYGEKFWTDVNHNFKQYLNEHIK